MFGWFKKQSDDSASDDKTLSAIEQKLVTLIPIRVQSLEISDPVYCLRIWYYGTDAFGDRVPTLMLCSEANRRKVVAAKGDTAPHYLWCADELPDDHSSDIKDGAVTALCRRWYSKIGEQQPEEVELLRFRQMIQRVAKRLNQLPWNEYASVTDDFVVFAADGSHTYCADYDEMLASVPDERVELLRSRKLLGTRYWYTLSTEPEEL